jgi:hypothetical protein
MRGGPPSLIGSTVGKQPANAANGELVPIISETPSPPKLLLIQLRHRHIAHTNLRKLFGLDCTLGTQESHLHRFDGLRGK